MCAFRRQSHGLGEIVDDVDSIRLAPKEGYASSRASHAPPPEAEGDTAHEGEGVDAFPLELRTEARLPRPQR